MNTPQQPLLDYEALGAAAAQLTPAEVQSAASSMTAAAAIDL